LQELHIGEQVPQVFGMAAAFAAGCHPFVVRFLERGLIERGRDNF